MDGDAAEYGLKEDQHLQQLQAYLRAGRAERARDLKELERTFASASQGSSETIYTRDEVMDLLSRLSTDVRAAAEKDLTFAHHGAAGMLRQLLRGAEAAGLRLAIDTRELDAPALAAAMARLEAASAARPGGGLPATIGAPMGRLDALGALEEHRAGSERERAARAGQADAAALNSKLHSLEKELEGEQRAAAQAEAGLQRLRKELAAEREARAEADRRAAAAEQQAARPAGSTGTGTPGGAAGGRAGAWGSDAGGAGAPAAGASADGTAQAQLAAARREASTLADKLAAAKADLAAAEASAGAKLNESKQFLQLKKMMQAKTAQLMAVRKRLAVYEPDVVDDADG